VIPGGPSRAGIERLRGQYGEDSNIYRARVLSEFPTQDAEGLIARDWIDAAVERHRTGALKPSGEPRASLDVARYGSDGNCLMIAKGPVVVLIETWGGLSTLNTARKAGEIIRRYGIRPPSPSKIAPGPTGSITVDAVGMTGAVEGLKEMGYTVHEFNGGTFGVGQARFLNRRAEAFFTLRDRLHPDSGNIALPRDNTLIEELLAIRWREAAGGKVRIEEKSEIKSRLGRSPDKADALSMLFGAKRRVTKSFEFRLV
jgi:phage terminase large subunit